MRIFGVLILLLSVSNVAFAGKLEREFKKDSVDPEIKHAETAMKTSCGCSLKVTLDEKSVNTMDLLRGAKWAAKNLADGLEKYCTDDASKKAMCKMNVYAIDGGKDAKFKFAKGKGSATVTESNTISFKTITDLLDK